MSGSAATEQQIAQRLVAAGVRLRFDKVAVRLLDTVKARVSRALPTDQTIAFTITAPIRLPAKTAAILQEWMLHVRAREASATINGNETRARLLHNIPGDSPRVVGFVHNPDGNATLILDTAETSLRGQ